MPERRLLILLNPSAGNGKPLRHQETILHAIRQAGLSFEYHVPTSTEQFDSLVIQACKSAFTDIILVGGYGTLHRAVELLMQQDPSDRMSLVLELIALGTGIDWIRTFHPSLTLEENHSLIIRGNTIWKTVGKITTTERTTHFINMAGFGFSGAVVQKLERFKKWGRFSYILSALATLFPFKTHQVVLQTATEKHSISLFALFAGLGKYAGGGMMLCPEANTGEDTFQITAIPQLPLYRMLSLLPALYNGKLLQKKNIMHVRLNSFSLRVSSPESINGECDGETVCSNQFNIDLLPKAIKVIV